MIRAKTPIVNKQETIKSVKYYTVANKIIPIRRVSFDMISRLEEPVNTEIELTKKDIKRVVVEKKKNNPLNKFFKKALKYIDKLEDFIDTMKSLKLKTIVQKKILLETDKSQQKIREYQAKRIVKENQQVEENQQQQEVNLKDVGDTLAAALGLGAIAAGGAAGAEEIPTVDYQPVVGQLVPKGTSGVSGYPITSNFGRRWGRNHGGIDVGVPVGTMFAIKAKSQVVFAGWQDPQDHKKGYGLLVDVWIPSIKQMIRFAHLTSVAVRVGQELEAGKVLGKSGSTGSSTGPHFHIEAHDSITSGYGTKDPTPYLGHVILGDEIKSNQADGGIDFNKRIMVGEAGTEFVVPMSQMPLFMQAMMDEKIKSLNPFYEPEIPHGNFGIKPSSGKFDEAFASGKILINYNNPNYSIAAKKLKQLFPMAKNYHIAGAMGNFEIEAPGLIPTTQQPDGPGYGIAQWTKTQRWGGTDSPLYYSALKFGGPSIATSLTKQLEFVKFELTDPRAADNIAGGHQKPSPLQKWLATKDVVSAADTWMKVYEQPGEPHWDRRKAAAIDFNKNMNKLLGVVSNKPSDKGKPKEENLWDKFKNLLNPSKKKASLNDIDQSNQMEVAKAYQNQFELNTDNVNQIIPLQIRVHYSETA